MATEILERLKDKVYRAGTLSSEDVTDSMATSLDKKLPPAFEKNEVAIGNATRRDKAPYRGTSGVSRSHSPTRYDVLYRAGRLWQNLSSVATAVEALKSRTIRKIVLVRPAVEAGESLGYLPCDLHEKLIRTYVPF